MRGTPAAQPEFLPALHLNAAVPAHHPLRAIQPQIDAVVRKLSPQLDRLYGRTGPARHFPGATTRSPSFDGTLSVCRERLFCEQLR